MPFGMPAMLSLKMSDKKGCMLPKCMVLSFAVQVVAPTGCRKAVSFPGTYLTLQLLLLLENFI